VLPHYQVTRLVTVTLLLELTLLLYLSGIVISRMLPLRGGPICPNRFGAVSSHGPSDCSSVATARLLERAGLAVRKPCGRSFSIQKTGVHAAFGRARLKP